MTHTPEPWQWNADFREVQGDGQYAVAIVVSAGHRYDGSLLTPDEAEADANAHLIAAAPEMYGLLQGLYDAIAGEENGEYMDNTGWLVRIGDTLATHGLVVHAEVGA